MNNDIYLIKWQDAAGGSNLGWRDLKDLKELRTATVISCGIILEDTEEFIIVCPHIIIDDNKNITEGDAELVIPRSWITEMKCIGEF
ncbi:MAG TPA: hypothetical protein DCM10_17495 [Xanthomarina gelatinilytica]|nr:hypothetical protein [Xanthomarina gelatinilytica]|tara:strand:- start:205 stop:465 length:261 start_codon:yes stop_codon:yes gene_type:complete